MNYIIISLKHGTAGRPVFWRAHNAGYTYQPFAAGEYTEEQIKSKPEYYNNGSSTIAVPISDNGMSAIDFHCSYDQGELEKFWKENHKELNRPIKPGKGSSIPDNTPGIDKIRKNLLHLFDQSKGWKFRVKGTPLVDVIEGVDNENQMVCGKQFGNFHVDLCELTNEDTSTESN